MSVTVLGLGDIDASVDKKIEAMTFVDSDDSECNSQLSTMTTAKTYRRKRRGRGRKKSKSSKSKSVPENPADNLSLDEQMKYVAMDCEMVGVGYHGKKSAVARVVLIGWNGETLFDHFVKQDRPVTDYRTFVSGITEDDLRQATMNLNQCQTAVEEILEDKILVGHALKNDMKALNITHPWQMTRDTAKYEPFMQTRFDDGILWPRKLKDLAKLKLKRDIQILGTPHSAYEDALAALDLYKKHFRKWEKAMEYKINKTQTILSAKAVLSTIATE